MSARPQFIVYNSTVGLTAAPVKQPTGTAIRTMMQMRPALLTPLTLVEWGCSFDAMSAGVPGQVELFEGDVAATMTTAYAAADVQPYNLAALLALQSAGASGIPLNLSTTTSGFATAAVTEGTTTAVRHADIQLVAPTDRHWKQWPLGREFDVQAQKYLRVRATFPVSVNMICYVIFEM